MIRDYLLNELTDALGEPKGKRSREWWIDFTHERNMVHICLNEKITTHDDAHLLVFDPKATLGKSVIELHPSTRSEADQAVQLVRRVVIAAADDYKCAPRPESAQANSPPAGIRLHPVLEIDSAYQHVGQRCVYRPQGVASAEELVQLIAGALLRARTESLRESLMNTTRITGFESPGPAFRRWAVGLWAKAVRSKMRVAIVARPEHICPQKTGLFAAAEEGLDANIFEAEPAALAWLDASNAPSHVTS